MSTLNKYDPVEENWKTLIVGKKGDKGDPGDQGLQGPAGDTHVPDPALEPDGQTPVTAGGVLTFQKHGNVGSTDIDTIVVLTQAQYDALGIYDPATLYVIEEV